MKKKFTCALNTLWEFFRYEWKFVLALIIALVVYLGALSLSLHDETRELGLELGIIANLVVTLGAFFWSGVLWGKFKILKDEFLPPRGKSRRRWLMYHIRQDMCPESSILSIILVTVIVTMLSALYCFNWWWCVWGILGYLPSDWITWGMMFLLNLIVGFVLYYLRVCNIAMQQVLDEIRYPSCEEQYAGSTTATSAVELSNSTENEPDFIVSPDVEELKATEEDPNDTL